MARSRAETMAQSGKGESQSAQVESLRFEVEHGQAGAQALPVRTEAIPVLQQQQTAAIEQLTISQLPPRPDAHCSQDVDASLPGQLAARATWLRTSTHSPATRRLATSRLGRSAVSHATPSSVNDKNDPQDALPQCAWFRCTCGHRCSESRSVQAPCTSHRYISSHHKCPSFPPTTYRCTCRCMQIDLGRSRDKPCFTS